MILINAGMAKDQRPKIKLEFQSPGLILEGLAALIALPIIYLGGYPMKPPGISMPPVRRMATAAR
jgi:hypothetical protein